MQVWCDWQLTLCDPHLSALEVRFHDDALYKSMFTFTFKTLSCLKTLSSVSCLKTVLRQFLQCVGIGLGLEG